MRSGSLIILCALLIGALCDDRVVKRTRGWNNAQCSGEPFQTVIQYFPPGSSLGISNAGTCVQTGNSWSIVDQMPNGYVPPREPNILQNVWYYNGVCTPGNEQTISFVGSYVTGDCPLCTCQNTPCSSGFQQFCNPGPTGCSTQCGQVDEHQNAYLACPSGTITSIEFASFGNSQVNTGSCVSQQGSCSASSSLNVMRSACVGQSSCAVQAESTIFNQDPCPGQFKRLGYIYKCSCPQQPPSTSTTGSNGGCDNNAPIQICGAAAENSDLTLTCPNGRYMYEFNLADYGNAASSGCSQVQMDPSCQRDVSSYVNNQCNGRNSCTIRAVNDNFGDPCPGRYKKLNVWARCFTAPPCNNL